jgi:cobalt/nickel transport system ATP-binding protein
MRAAQNVVCATLPAGGTFLLGEVVVLKIGIVGLSQVGKTTLFRALTQAHGAGLGSARPEAHVGVVRVPDARLDRLAEMFHPQRTIHATIEYVDTPGSVIELARTGVQSQNLREMNALALVGAEHLKDRPPYKLSGGEKRAVSIATVLSMSPSILVMDEPTSNLDPRARRQLIHLLSEFDHTKIIATHDMDMVLDLCSRAIVIKDGEVAADGAAEEMEAQRRS